MLEVSFLAIPMLTGRKTVQKEGFGPKCGFSLKVADGKGLEGTLRYENGDADKKKKVTQLLESIEVGTKLHAG